LVVPRIEPGAFEFAARNSDHYTIEAVNEYQNKKKS
jgi:hypothetical protein